MLALPSPLSDAVDDLPQMLQRPVFVAAERAQAVLSWEPGREGAHDEIPPRWRLEGVVAVIDRAEGLFPGAHVRARRDGVSFSDIAAAFEDLLMLAHRFRLALDDSASAAFDERYDDMTRAFRIRAAPAPELIAGAARRFSGILRPFQAEGVQFMLASRGALLADDMGLGKTVQAFAYLDALDRWPAVVVCQSHVQTHWERKIGEFLDCERARGDLLGRSGGRLRWASLRGAKADGATPTAEIYFVHYLVVHAWVDLLLSRGVQVVVFDEAQELRCTGTRKAEANRQLARKARAVVGLSGTPIYNKGIEIYNVMNVIDHGCLGPKVSFQEKWCSESDPAIVAAPDALGDYLRDRGLMLRRRKADVLDELPPKQRVIEPIDAEAGLFRELVQEAIDLARDAELVGESFQRGQLEALAIMKLRKATGIAKTRAAVAFLRTLMEAGQPTLVSAHHTAVHEAISDALAEFRPARITGEESSAQKDVSRQRFINGDTDLLQIALRAATGIDGLQARARVVVHVELDWSPQVHAQLEDRAWRYGQKGSVLVYYLTSDLGSDPFVMGGLMLKEQQFLGLMSDAAESDDDRRAAQATAEQHKAEMLAMLRGGRM